MAIAGAVVIDTQSIIRVWGKSCTDIFGLEEEDAVGKSLFDTIMPVRYQLLHLRGIQQYIDTGVAPVVGVATKVYGLFHAKDGTVTEIPIELAISILPSGRGRQYDEFSAVILSRGR